MRARRAQAMLETVLAVVFTTFVLSVAFLVMNMLHARILLDHASMRAARAKAVGLNDFMCLKSARAAMIPVAGKMLWPDTGETGSGFSEAARVPLYMASENGAIARGILDYEYWGTSEFKVDSDHGVAPAAKAYVRMQSADFTMDGRAEVECHYPLYMQDLGL